MSNFQTLWRKSFSLIVFDFFFSTLRLADFLTNFQVDFDRHKIKRRKNTKPKGKTRKMANFSEIWGKWVKLEKKKFYFSCKSIRFDFLKNALKNEVVKVEKVDAPIYLKSKSLLRVVVGKKVSVKFHSPLTNSVVRYSHCSKIPFHAQKLPLKIAEN